MQDWNPISYLQFATERTRPAEELANRINYPQARSIIDLGCGPGNSTAVLCKKYPVAKIVGIDNSPAMLEKARNMLPGCQFEAADISNWRSQKKQDVIFANASLHWINNHDVLLPHLVSQLVPQGVLAIQMPDNWQEQTHRLMRDVAEELNAPFYHQNTVLKAESYYHLLSQAGCQVDIWRTTYFHELPSTQAIIDWLLTTGLRRFVNNLNLQQQEAYLQRYHKLLNEHYKEQDNGKVLMPFPRLFIVARRMV
ncbi:trans-aconitate 2-methyltransferase [Citrobacter sp. JGM124]|uniref:trans-aconitate 2-methyltransferase n=1 Tax=Citrobacter sp. JGM124 TaxID=2799789 RepID=UPI001BA9567E|nr:trans-aconitate 2-methyltransferase [Citrobacter sp. JGM124]MBS0847300.1 trans-aconitate 2-methyltransferase [Citrobacter sp. JGM124]